MASSTRPSTLSGQEVLLRIQKLELNDYDDDEFDVDDASSDEDIVMSNESSGDSETESYGSDRESATDENVDGKIIAPSGKIWKLTCPRQTRTTANNIANPAALTRRRQNIETVQDAFELFIDDQIRTILADLTNKFAHSKEPNWKHVDDTEMKGFIGLLL